MKNNKYNNLNNAIDTAVKIFIFAALAVAVGILIITFVNFYQNQQQFLQTFTETLGNVAINDVVPVTSKEAEQLESGATNDSGNTSNSGDVLLSLRMQYLEKISDMHRQASNNDLFVFIYGFLSSVLIGLSAYFVKEGQKQLETLTEKYKKLNGKADSVEQRLNIHENAMQFNVTTNILSEALISILSYSITLNNGNLTSFKQAVREVSDLCKKGDLSHIDEAAATTFERNLQTVEGIYYSVAKKKDSEINEIHQKFMQEDFDSIREKLAKR